MGVSDTVQALAETLESAKKPTDARQRLLLAILRTTPLYRDVGDLCAWESAFQCALPEEDDESEMGNLLWEIFELGRFNMYAGFDYKGTRHAFDNLMEAFRNAGVPTCAHRGLDDV